MYIEHTHTHSQTHENVKEEKKGKPQVALSYCPHPETAKILILKLKIKAKRKGGEYLNQYHLVQISKWKKRVRSFMKTQQKCSNTIAEYPSDRFREA